MDANISTILAKYKAEIDRETIQVLKEYSENFITSGSLVAETMEKLQTFIVGGKSIRGSLFLWISELFGYDNTRNIIRLAVALEMLHSAELIHDDIIDNDDYRRSNLSMHAQYISRFRSRITEQSSREIAKSVGIGIGDSVFFMGFNLLHQTRLPSSSIAEVVSKICEIFTEVNFGQIDDIYYSTGIKEPSKEEIVSIYLHKTARYTFSLPISLSAIVLGLPSDVQTKLSLLGEYIGLIFQIRDDELCIYYDTPQSGKPMGTDIRENKRTLIRYLFMHSSSTDKKILDLFGNKALTKNHIHAVSTLYETSGIKKNITEIVSDYTQKAENIINDIPFDQKVKQYFRDLIQFVGTRNK